MGYDRESLEKEAQQWVEKLPAPIPEGMSKEAVAWLPLLMGGLGLAGLGGTAAWGLPRLADKTIGRMFPNYWNTRVLNKPLSVRDMNLINLAGDKIPFRGAGWDRMVGQMSRPMQAFAKSNPTAARNLMVNTQKSLAEAGGAGATAAKGMGGMLKSPMGMMMAGLLAAQILPKLLGGGQQRQAAPMMTMPMMMPGGYY